MKKCILFGADVQHSLSPTIYQIFASHYGVSFDYRVASITPASLPRQIERVIDAGYIGCNLTNPLKQQLANQVLWGDALAARFRSVNVLHFQDSLQPTAWNTDGIGFIEAIQQHRDCRGDRVLLLGSGGIVPPLAYYLHLTGAALTIAARNVARLHTQMQGVLPVPVPLIAFAAIKDHYDLVINATSVGWEVLEPQFIQNPLKRAARYYDCRYGSSVASSLQRVMAQGVPEVYCGLGMLIRQAAHAFSIWTGHMPDEAVMKIAEQCCRWR
jgi:shikimate dehydrogenase